jgi:hypothetical protein
MAYNPTADKKKLLNILAWCKAKEEIFFGSRDKPIITLSNSDIFEGYHDYYFEDGQLVLITFLPTGVDPINTPISIVVVNVDLIDNILIPETYGEPPDSINLLSYPQGKTMDEFCTLFFGKCISKNYERSFVEIMNSTYENPKIISYTGGVLTLEGLIGIHTALVSGTIKASAPVTEIKYFAFPIMDLRNLELVSSFNSEIQQRFHNLADKGEVT